jgi:DNA-binding Xre family transcriptional regulator
MTYSKIQYNLENILTKKQIEVEELCKLAGVNEYEIDMVLSSPMISVDNQILTKIANALNCTMFDLFNGDKNTNATSKTSKKSYNKIKSKKLLPSFSKINIELLSDSVAKIDEIISSEGKNIDTDQRVMAYLAFYELADNFIKNKQ